LTLGGCGSWFGKDGYFRDRGDDYLQATSVEPIKLPQGSEGERIGQLFVVPRISNAGASLPEEFEVPKPANVEKLSEQLSQIKIQKLGQRRWVDINVPPDQVWPGVREFLLSQGMPVAAQDPVAGTVETGWIALQTVEDDGSKTRMSGKNRYRIQLEPGLKPGSTEIHVLQMTAPEAATQGYLAWPEQSMDGEREVWMVREVANYLAQHPAPQSSLLAQGIGSGEQRTEIVQRPEPALVMRVDAERAWASVNGSLGRGGFRIDSSLREQQQWQVTYAEQATSAVAEDAPAAETSETKKPGLMSRLWGSDSSADTGMAGSYRVSLQRHTADRMRVIIRNGNGEELPAERADKLLRRIQDNLL
ncbi:MAG: outer membrane protein assembly factor BamC, partial [Pseudomonadales bacterium]|nr:outer membrane protein assembly factor BamC [Pseudomonadales bacterium]